jgi:hypothetical protein
MPSSRLVICVILLGAISAAGCGHPMTVLTPPPKSAQVTLAITDTPPVGITVLAFQATFTGATMQPGSVSLLSAPTPIDLNHLQADTALLSTTAAATGTYTSLTLTLTNPVLTIQNDSATTFSVGGTSCAPGTVCELTPTSMGTLTVSTAPFPLTLMTNTPVGLLVDMNLTNLINPDASVNLSAAGGMTVSTLTPVAGVLAPVEDMVGVVASKDVANSRFTLQRTQGNMVISVDSNTKFTGFGQAAPPCAANPLNFTCVVNGQIVQVNAELQTAGTLLATIVRFEDDAGQEEAEGIVVGIGPGVPPAQFDLVIVGETSSISAVQVGAFFRVQYVNGTTFAVDDAAVNTSNFPFASASDMQFGQEVQVRVRTTTPGTPPFITADQIKLRSSRFTAKIVGTPSGTTFNVNTLPTLFVVNGIAQVQVQTSVLTEFQNVSGVSGLAAGNTVSLRGPLFQTAGGVVLASEVVRKH